MATSPRNFYLFVIEGLNPSALGPYGNAQIETLGFNTLASLGTSYKEHYLQREGLPSFYQELTLAPTKTASSPDRPNWHFFENFPEKSGSHLVTDNPAVDSILAESFENRTTVPPVENHDSKKEKRCEEIDETAIGHFFRHTLSAMSAPSSTDQFY
ncbi:MAG: hypothetical protein MPJ24_03440, partial [Pirellulaceae bacterium]|nr:hypothetical protein [Pirellulaceae bacterium]